MSILRLKQNRNVAPSGCVFTDPRTGKSFDPYEMGIQMTVRGIIAHRLRNSAIYKPDESQYFDYHSVTQELYRAINARRPDLFIGGPDNGTPSQVVVKKSKSNIVMDPSVSCKCGSKNLKPVFCKVCSGTRLLGFECLDCGFKTSK